MTAAAPPRPKKRVRVKIAANAELIKRLKDKGSALDLATCGKEALYAALEEHCPKAIPTKADGFKKKVASFSRNELITAANAYALANGRQARQDARAADTSVARLNAEAAAEAPAPRAAGDGLPTEDHHVLRQQLAEDHMRRVVQREQRSNDRLPFRKREEFVSWFQRELNQLAPDVAVRLEGRLAGVFDELYADADEVDLEGMLRESLLLDQQVLVAAQTLYLSMERKPTLPELLVQLDRVHRRTSGTPLTDRQRAVVEETYEARASEACAAAETRRLHGAFKDVTTVNCPMAEHLRTDEPAAGDAAPKRTAGSRFLPAQDVARLDALENKDPKSIRREFPNVDAPLSQKLSRRAVQRAERRGPEVPAGKPGPRVTPHNAPGPG